MREISTPIEIIGDLTSATSNPDTDYQPTMTEDRFEQHIEDVQETLQRAEEQTETEISVADEEIEEQFKQYAEKRVDPEDCVENITKSILKDAGISNPNQFIYNGTSRSSGVSEDVPMEVEEIEEDSRWIQFTGVVLELYDSTDPIAQHGRLVDDTGSIRFTIFEGDTDELLEVGKCYRLDPVVTNEYKGEYELKLRNETDITELEGGEALDIDIENYTEKKTGTIIDFQSQMGLINRCEECNRVLTESDYCPDCGDVDSELDLRIKAVIDNGEDSWTVFFNAEQTEQLTGMSLEDAKNKAREHSDRAVVREYIERKTHAEYIELHGRDRGRRFDVEEFEKIDVPTNEDFENILDHMQSLVSEQEA